MQETQNQLKDELEETIGALKALDARATQLAGRNHLLEEQIRNERGQRDSLEQHLTELREELSAAVNNRDTQIQQLRQQLSTTLEELRVMSEELSRVKDLLDRPAAHSATADRV